jgi:hypothetical protein
VKLPDENPTIYFAHTWVGLGDVIATISTISPFPGSNPLASRLRGNIYIYSQVNLASVERRKREASPKITPVYLGHNARKQDKTSGGDSLAGGHSPPFESTLLL